MATAAETPCFHTEVLDAERIQPVLSKYAKQHTASSPDEESDADIDSATATATDSAALAPTAPTSQDHVCKKNATELAKETQGTKHPSGHSATVFGKSQILCALLY